ncbi:MAG TPA: hypothetical protein VK324_02710 [Tepidisphaeraceae bacterium]|nr:hypothetical protein [Tepidisphaeraceae bacterium]
MSHHLVVTDALRAADRLSQINIARALGYPPKKTALTTYESRGNLFLTIV